MGLFQPAVKERLKARVAIDGPTGSGKSWTALQWARIIAGPDGPVGVVDTENRSAAYYAPTPAQLLAGIERVNYWDPPYVFGHLVQTAPYDPRNLARIIDAAGEELGPDGVLVIDSLTHFWNGEGGTLDIVDDAASRSYGNNTFGGWKEGTPAQRFMLDRIVHAKCHVIVTMRSKMEYVMKEVQRNGQTYREPTKVGMAPEQRAGVEYEFTVVADMDLEHRLVVSKSRCDDIADVVAPKGRSADVAEAFKDWLGTGVTRVDEAQAAALMAPFDQIADDDHRKHLKYDFVAAFGLPAELLTDKLPVATEWVAEQVAKALTPPAAHVDEPVDAGPPDPADPVPEPDVPTYPEPDPVLDAPAPQAPPQAPEVGGALADAVRTTRKRKDVTT